MKVEDRKRVFAFLDQVDHNNAAEYECGDRSSECDEYHNNVSEVVLLIREAIKQLSNEGR